MSPPSRRVRTLDLATDPSGATLVVTGDDTADVWVNGVAVSTSPRVTDSWRRAAVLDLTGRLFAGRNVIAVRAENTSQSPAGLIGKLTIQNGQTVVTDAGWKANQGAPDGWQQNGFDDSAWPAARALVPYGSGPWASNVAISQPSPLLRKGARQQWVKPLDTRNDRARPPCCQRLLHRLRSAALSLGVVGLRSPVQCVRPSG